MTTLPLQQVPAESALRADRTCRRLLLGIDAAFFVYAAAFVLLAPCGYWMNHFGNAPLWPNGDPGASYVVSALFFFDPGRYPPFFGHPGLTLQFPIALAAHAVFSIYHLLGGAETYLQFWAIHIRWLFIIGGLMAATAHVVSFHVLYAFARKLFDDARPAILAVLGYATMLPTLFYATRISVEPIMVTTVLAAFLCLWSIDDALAIGNRRRAMWMASLAAFFAVAGLYTKIHLAGPLVGFALLQLLTQSRGDGRGIIQRVREKLGMAAIFIAVAALLLWLGTFKLNWPEFMASWSEHGLDRQTKVIVHAKNAGLLSHIHTAAATVAHSIRTFVPLYFQSTTHQGVFAIAEIAFILIALIGVVLFWKNCPQKRRLLFWPLLYALLILPVPLYRGFWHYLFLHFAIGSVFFGFALWTAATRLLFWPGSEGLRLALASLAVVIIHSAAIYYGIDSKCQDAHQYRRGILPYHDALLKCHSGERVAVVAGAIEPWRFHGSPPKWVPGAPDFLQLFDSFFIVVPDKQTITKEWLAANKVKAVVTQRRSGATAHDTTKRKKSSASAAPHKKAKHPTSPTAKPPARPTTRRAPATQASK